MYDEDKVSRSRADEDKVDRDGLVSSASSNRYLVGPSANLAGADLPNRILNSSSLSLTGVNLRRANLTGANLSVMILNETDLSLAKLINADLTGAELNPGVDLRAADLTGADLGADLNGGVTLTNAKMEGVTTLQFLDPLPAGIAGTPQSLPDRLTLQDGTFAYLASAPH